jgi:hypothetical protein
MRMRPTAIGIEVFPHASDSRNGARPGKSLPATSPAPIARKIQRVR